MLSCKTSIMGSQSPSVVTKQLMNCLGFGVTVKDSTSGFRVKGEFLLLIVKVFLGGSRVELCLFLTENMCHADDFHSGDKLCPSSYG